MRAGFRVSRGHDFVIYVAYLDEFGHVGPYIGRSDPRHNTSPVFGFAGFILPAEAVRGALGRGRPQWKSAHPLQTRNKRRMFRKGDHDVPLMRSGDAVV